MPANRHVLDRREDPVKRAKNLLMRSALAVCAAVLAMLGPANVPAHAASQIFANVGINIDGTPTTGGRWDNAWINVHLPMNQGDALGYIINGATITIRCWGDDSFSDDDLLRSDRYVYSGDGSGRYYLPGANVVVEGVNRLYADAYGVNLTAIISYKYNSGGHAHPFKGFNEDVFPDGDGDEVFCKATWTDGDGDTLAGFTNVVRGRF